ncbi:MAG: hypothetical protein EP343_09075 [Deltaproteobacteria bacterium]|nr:MAG: hypothetical protein EP343_09075 [Deltaproteobacteria bacterium]
MSAQSGWLAGRYELLSMLGEGGMGSVYRAQDHELEEIVAVKVLRTDLLQRPKLLARFRQEVRLARRITHRNVARTFDLGTTDGTFYLTMEYIEGVSLYDFLERTPVLPLKVWFDLALQICRGLEAAHEEEITHRDLKPDNILISKKGRVVVSDFGIARLKDSQHINTTAGVVMGTPRYMAPEQLKSLPDLDERVDIYALGALFYEMLTGKPAWDGPTPIAIAFLRFAEPPPDPRKVNPAVPEELAELVIKCMARERNDRYDDISDIIEALESMQIEGLDLHRMHRRSSARRSPTMTPLRQFLLEQEKAIEEAKATGQHKTDDGDSDANAITPQRSTPTNALTIAVMPLRSDRGTTDPELASEVEEELVDQLSVLPNLRVRRVGPQHRVVGQETDTQAIGTALNVKYLLQGSVKLVEEKVTFKLRLLVTQNGYQRWAGKAQGSVDHVEAMCQGIVAQVEDALRSENVGHPTILLKPSAKK